MLLRIPPRLNVRFGLIALGCIGGHGGSGPGSAEGGPLSPPPRPPALCSHTLTAKPRQASGSVAKLLLQLRTRPGDASHLRQLDKRREEEPGRRGADGAVLVRGDNILCVEDAGPSRVPDGRGQPRGCSHGDARRREALFTAATAGYGKGFSESRDGNKELRCA